MPPTEADKQTNAPAKPHQPRPNLDASGKYHIGDGVTAPILIHSVEPEFANNLGSGNCTIGLTVNIDGKPTDIHLIPPSKSNPGGPTNPEFGMLCISAVKQYQFKPAMFRGKPVPVELHLEINSNHF